MRQRFSPLNPGEEGLVSVLAWRRRQLEQAGFATPLADALARDTRIDLHAVLELIDRGCPPALAARIVAPLDEPLGGAA